VIDIAVSEHFETLEAAAWNQLVGESSPFLEHAWLLALDRTECVDPQEGWLGQTITAWQDGDLVGGIPLYLKGNSRGEFVYDWSWADLAGQIGVSYYPKLIAAIPFTPVTGTRLLVHPELSGDDREKVLNLLVQGALEWTDRVGAQGLHFLFTPKEEADRLAEHGFLTRLGFQYHWRNRGYDDFDDFLGAFRHKRRNQILRERREMTDEGISFRVYTGDEITPHVIDQMFHFYSLTCARFGRSTGRYLNRAFWQEVGRTMPHRLQILLAHRDTGVPVAGTLTLRKGDRWYGRYWGCDETVRFLHFNACFYVPIEQAISEGVQTYEPGAGGQHKFGRGFEPVLTYSSHYLPDPNLRSILTDFVAREATAVHADVEALLSSSPLKR
jgi:predicted N-acyltransferase